MKTERWNAAEFLTTPEDVAACLEVALEEDDPELLKTVLGNIARSKGMTEISERTGLNRQHLYKALSPDGNPEFSTITSVLAALGLRLRVTRGRPAPIEYPVTITPIAEDDGHAYYTASAPDLPGCMSDGETPEMALEGLRTAIEDWKEEALRTGRHIPEPKRHLQAAE